LRDNSKSYRKKYCWKHRRKEVLLTLEGQHKQIQHTMKARYNTKGILVAILLLVMAMGLRAQHSETSIYINGILPLGQYGSMVENPIPVPFDRQHIAKGATMGVGASFGWGYKIDIGFGLLEPNAEAGFNWNGSNREIRTTFEDSIVNNERPAVPNYFNVPILIDLKYIYEFTDVFKPFVHVGFGVDFLFIGNNGYRDVATKYYRYKPTGSFCWQAGIGTYLTDLLSISVQYEGMGQHLIDYTGSSAVAPGDDMKTERRNIGCMNFRLGFHF